MKITQLPLLSLVCVQSIFAGEITLTSKDGRKLSGELIAVHDSSVKIRKADGAEFTIDFRKLDEATVGTLEKIALEEKAAAMAKEKEMIAARESEQARIPKFPENPKTLADLPEKIVIKVEDGKKSAYAFARVDAFFVEPKPSPSPRDSDAVLSVSTTFGGGEIMTVISQKLADGDVSMKLIALTAKDTGFPEPIELTVPSKLAKSTNGVASAGYFSKRFPGDVTEIILYDFKAVP